MINDDFVGRGMEGLKKEGNLLKKEVKEKVLAYILAALGFVAGLAWNDAIKAVIEHFFPLSKDTVLAKIVYAVLITLLVVLFTVYLVRLLRKDEK